MVWEFEVMWRQGVCGGNDFWKCRVKVWKIKRVMGKKSGDIKLMRT